MSSEPSPRGEIRVGPAGWSYQDWKRIVYPDARPRTFHEAAYLAQYFDVIEINTSFYHPLRPELARVWVRKIASNPRFQFTAKLYRTFTHEGRLDASDVRLYQEGLAPIAESGRLGCVLMQFPWSFKFNRENRDHYLYTANELAEWKDRIEQVASQARSTYVVTNNHFEGKAVVNGLQLIHLLFGDLVQTPPDLLNAYPELASISRNAPQQRNLF